MKKYFSLLFLMTSVLLPISAQTEEVTVIEDSTATIIDEANEAINIADAQPSEVVDTVSEQTNTGPTLTPAGDGLLWQINKYRC